MDDKNIKSDRGRYCGKHTNRRRDRTPNGYWSETFESFEEAWNYAKSTGKKTLTHAPSASGKELNWKEVWEEMQKQND